MGVIQLLTLTDQQMISLLPFQGGQKSHFSMKLRRSVIFFRSSNRTVVVRHVLLLFAPLDPLIYLNN
jgi:hypothetical protein